MFEPKWLRTTQANKRGAEQFWPDQLSKPRVGEFPLPESPKRFWGSHGLLPSNWGLQPLSPPGLGAPTPEAPQAWELQPPIGSPGLGSPPPSPSSELPPQKLPGPPSPKLPGTSAKFCRSGPVPAPMEVRSEPSSEKHPQQNIRPGCFQEPTTHGLSPRPSRFVVPSSSGQLSFRHAVPPIPSPRAPAGPGDDSFP